MVVMKILTKGDIKDISKEGYDKCFGIYCI